MKSTRSLLKLKRTISQLQNNIYLQSSPVEDLRKVNFRIVRSYPLPYRADPVPYSEYLEHAGRKLTLNFVNLTGDVMLIIPTKPYATIYLFAKEASDREWLALFRRTASLTKKGDHISTHGHGVSWLHVRIEETPKYYHSF